MVKVSKRHGNRIGVLVTLGMVLYLIIVFLMPVDRGPLTSVDVVLRFVGDVRRESAYAPHYLNRRWILIAQEDTIVIDVRTRFRTTIAALLRETGGEEARKVGAVEGCSMIAYGPFVFLVSDAGKIEAIASWDAFADSGGDVFLSLCPDVPRKDVLRKKSIRPVHLSPARNESGGSGGSGRTEDEDRGATGG